MYPQRQEATLFDNTTPVAVNSSTNATPIVVTANAHGLATGRRVLIQGHATNTNANGIFQVGATTANTFQLLDEVTGANTTGNGVGSGGYCMSAPQVLYCIDFNNLDFSLITNGTTTASFLAAISSGIPASKATSPRGGYPNMGATQSQSNPYSFSAITDLQSNTVIAGGTGVALTATDVDNQYELVTHATRYFTVIPTGWTGGTFTVKATLRTVTP